MRISIPKTQSPSTDAVAGLMTLFGPKLPSEYIDFLNEHDGAKPEENVFSLGAGNSAGVDEFISARDAVRIRDIVEGFPRKVLPVARATAGNFVYLDPANGAIFFWDHESDAADMKLANSLHEFLANLQPFDLDQVKLKPGQVKKVWVKPGFKPKF